MKPVQSLVLVLIAVAGSLGQANAATLECIGQGGLTSTAVVEKTTRLELGSVFGHSVEAAALGDLIVIMATQGEMRFSSSSPKQASLRLEKGGLEAEFVCSIR